MRETRAKQVHEEKRDVFLNGKRLSFFPTGTPLNKTRACSLSLHTFEPETKWHKQVRRAYSGAPILLPIPYGHTPLACERKPQATLAHVRPHKDFPQGIQSIREESCQKKWTMRDPMSYGNFFPDKRPGLFAAHPPRASRTLFRPSLSLLDLDVGLAQSASTLPSILLTLQSDHGQRQIKPCMRKGRMKGF